MGQRSKLPGQEEMNAEVERLINLFEKSNLNYQSLDEEGIIRKVNSSWLKTLGYKPEEVLNRWFGDLLTEESRSFYKEQYIRFLHEKKSKTVELTIHSSDKSVLSCEFTCIGSFDETGKLIRTHCVFQNITRLRHAEEALVASEKKYEQIIELSNVGIFEYDVRSRKFNYINSVIRNVLGVDRNSEENPDLLQLLLDECLTEHSRKMNDLLKGKKIPPTVDYRIKEKKGRYSWIRISNSYIQKGDTIIIIGVVQNITRQKLLEDELKQIRLRFEQISRHMPAVLFQFVLKKKKVEYYHISDKIKDFTGYKPGEVMKYPELISNMLGRKELGEISVRLREAVRTGKPIQLTNKIITRDGKQKYIDTLFTSTLTENKQILWTGVSIDITEKKVLKEQLEHSEKKFEALVNSAAPAISTMSKTGFVTSVNRRLCEMSGYSEKELLGKHFMNIPAFYLKDIPTYIKLYNAALKNELPPEPVRFEWKHKNGNKYYGEGYLSSILENGEITGYQAIMSDITQRVEMEKAESRRKKEANQLFESAVRLLSINKESDLFEFLADEMEKLIPGAIININSVDDDFTTVTVEKIRMPNRKKRLGITQLLGRQLEGYQFAVTPRTYDYAVAGRLMKHHTSLFELTLGQIPEKVCKQIEKQLGIESFYEISLGNDEKIIGGSVIFLRKDQQIDSTYQVETLFREASDALLRIRMHRKLDESEKLYKSLAESTGEWIMRFNNELKHIYINNAVSLDREISAKKILGKTCEQAGYSSQHSKLINEHLKEVLKNGKSSRCEIEMQLGNRTEFFEWCFYPEQLANKEHTILVYARNITGRKEIEGKLLESIAHKNKLYSIVSHDLRSPFNSMIGFLELLSDQYYKLTDEKRIKYIDLLKETSLESYKLLESVLHWAVENEEGREVKPGYFDLSALIRKALQIHIAPILENDLKISFSQTEPLYVYADYNMIFTVLRNLLSNAIKFSRSGSGIEIILEDMIDRVNCTIRDQGSGMSQETIKQIKMGVKPEIQPGIRGIKGTGLGLKLAYEFIRHNKGDIHFDSHPAKGTAITFYLMKRP